MRHSPTPGASPSISSSPSMESIVAPIHEYPSSLLLHTSIKKSADSKNGVKFSSSSRHPGTPQILINNNALPTPDPEPIPSDVLMDAATLIQDAAFRRYTLHRSDSLSLWYYNLFVSNSFQFFINATLFFHMLLATIESPSSIDGIHPIVPLLLELFFMAVYGLEIWLHLLFAGPKLHFGRIKNRLFAISVILTFMDASISYSAGSTFRITRLIRPIFLTNHFKFLRISIRNVFKSILPGVADVLLLLIGNVFLFGTIGYLLFGRSNIDQVYFRSWGQSLLSMTICLTTANFPDVMLPSYRHSHINCLFFIAFLIISLYFLMNIVLATIQNLYRESLKRDVFHDLSHQLDLLKRAFACMDRCNSGFIHFQSFCDLLKIMRPDYDQERVRLYFQNLDIKRNMVLDFEEFLEIRAVALTDIQERTKKRLMLEGLVPSFTTNPIFPDVRRAFKHRFLDIGMDFIFAAFAILAVSEAAATHEGTASVALRVASASDITIMILFGLEMFLKCLFLGRYSFFKRTWYRFDLFIFSFAVFFALLRSIHPLFSYPYLVQCTLILRNLRLCRFAKQFKRLGNVASTLKEAAPVLARFSAVLFVLWYVAAIVGIWLFSGKISPGYRNPELIGTDFDSSNYYDNNFNDFLSSFVVLFELMVVNNWYVTMNGFVAVTSEWHRIFFLVYYVFSVLIALNIVVAMVLTAFFQQFESAKSNVKDTDETAKGVMRYMWESPMVAGAGGAVIKSRSKTWVLHRRRGGNDVIQDLFGKEIADEHADNLELVALAGRRKFSSHSRANSTELNQSHHEPYVPLVAHPVPNSQQQPSPVETPIATPCPSGISTPIREFTPPSSPPRHSLQLAVSPPFSPIDASSPASSSPHAHSRVRSSSLNLNMNMDRISFESKPGRGGNSSRTLVVVIPDEKELYSDSPPV